MMEESVIRSKNHRRGRLIHSMCILQLMHDDIEKDDKFLTDPDNPFIDNGHSLSERFSCIEEELFAKTEYLKSMMIDSKIMVSD